MRTNGLASRIVSLPDVLLVAAAVAALVDWWSVAGGRARVEAVAKPTTMLVLVGVAATWGDPPGDVRTWLVVGAVFGVVGDVALLGSGEVAFLAGLSAFAVGHVAYAGAAIAVGVDPRWMLPGVVVMAALLAYRFVSRTLVGARRDGGAVLAGAVVFYAVVISLMVATAWGTGALVAAVGATLFAISDWVLGHQRFAGPLPGGRLSVMVPYHVGQALLLIGLAGA